MIKRTLYFFNPASLRLKDKQLQVEVRIEDEVKTTLVPVDLFLSISQRYILKANHNPLVAFVVDAKVFINKSKIHFESKSQHLLRVVQILSCFYQ